MVYSSSCLPYRKCGRDDRALLSLTRLRVNHPECSAIMYLIDWGIPDMNTIIMPESSQRELFSRWRLWYNMVYLLPRLPDWHPMPNRTICRSYQSADKYLHKPGISFTSNCCPWLASLYSWQDKNGKCLWCSISIISTVYWSETLLAGSVYHVESIPVKW